MSNEGNGITLEAFGFTKEELQEKLLERLGEQLLSGVGLGEDGQFSMRSDFAQKMRSAMEEKVDAIATAFAENVVGPNVTEYLNEILLATTDGFGNKKGEPKTFAEHVVGIFKAYLEQKVDDNGCPRDGYPGDRYITRAAWLVNNGIRSRVDEIIRDSLGMAVDSLKGGMEGYIKEALSKMTVALDTEVRQVR